MRKPTVILAALTAVGVAIAVWLCRTKNNIFDHSYFN